MIIIVQRGAIIKANSCFINMNAILPHLCQQVTYVITYTYYKP